jgi:2-polyprenyl-3-methyl-5-hydroxy-6-metoxy-1,4-benzoquinol methylase
VNANLHVEAVEPAISAAVAAAAAPVSAASASIGPVRAASSAVPAMEAVACYGCGSTECRDLVFARDDLTGKPGRFRFVTCASCGLAYQNPRVALDRIREYYDDEYIAHRKNEWGLLAPLFDRAMDKLDRQKDGIVSRYVSLTSKSHVLDIGCAVGTFLQRLRRRHACQAAGVDFKDLSHHPSLEGVEFHCGLFYEAPLGADRFDLVTMWHFLEHDYDPMRSLRTAHRVVKPGGHLVIEVPRLDCATFRLYGHRWPGLQAPQHTVLFDREQLLRFVGRAGWAVVDYLPYGAFPAYFYLFAGAAFTLLRGRGLNLRRAILPYFAGQLALLPLLVFERRLNLAMQTVICRRTS